MSDYVHSDRPKFSVRHWTLESRAMFAACYLLFLVRAVVHRVMPWRRPRDFGGATHRESIFTEAASAAGVLISSSFMGL
ncbi:MAG: hypothetical protein JWQ94_1759 [Tardiphaga sp.]|nr:hypothetical protein [Tardiphaga sp.]